MKLKTVFAASLLVGGVAFAEDITTTYTVGVMPLTIENQETVICVPWMESGNASGGVAVSNLVKTAGLNAGDKLYWYDANNTHNFASWTLTVDDGPWVQEAPSTGYPDVKADAAILNRGDAVILKLAAAPASSKTIYIVGQVGTGTATTQFTAPEGCSATNPFYVLIAPPSVGSETVDLNASYWTGVDNEDVLITGYGHNATYGFYEKRFAWGTTSGESPSYGWGTYSYDGPNKTFSKSATVPRGTGFFYKKCSSGTVTITWN